MDLGDAPSWTAVAISLASLGYALRKGRQADAAADVAADAQRDAAKALAASATAQERSASAHERAVEVAERQAGARLRIRWNGRAFTVVNTGGGMARQLSVMVRIGEWWGDQYADVLPAVPPQTDPSTPPTGWKFDFPIQEEPPEHLLGEAAHLTCFYLEEGGGRGTVESEGFRLERGG